MWCWMWLTKLIEPRQSMWYEHITRHLDRLGACFLGHVMGNRLCWNSLVDSSGPNDNFRFKDPMFWFFTLKSHMTTYKRDSSTVMSNLGYKLFLQHHYFHYCFNWIQHFWMSGLRPGVILYIAVIELIWGNKKGGKKSSFVYFWKNSDD